MRTFKEFISISEKFKPFPEDRVNRQIERKKTSGDEVTAHKLKLAKNYYTKMSNKTNTNPIHATKKLVDRAKSHGNDALLNMLQGDYEAANQNTKRIKGLETHANLTLKGKPEGNRNQISHNLKNKEIKGRLNNLLKNENQ